MYHIFRLYAMFREGVTYKCYILEQAAMESSDVKSDNTATRKVSINSITKCHTSNSWVSISNPWRVIGQCPTQQGAGSISSGTPIKCFHQFITGVILLPRKYVKVRIGILPQSDKLYMCNPFISVWL